MEELNIFCQPQQDSQGSLQNQLQEETVSAQRVLSQIMEWKEWWVKEKDRFLWKSNYKRNRGLYGGGRMGSFYLFDVEIEWRPS